MRNGVEDPRVAIKNQVEAMGYYVDLEDIINHQDEWTVTIKAPITPINVFSLELAIDGHDRNCTCGARHTSNPYHHSFWCDLA